MNLSKGQGASKVEVPMAPMIDIVFQLLIFFMLNLRMMAPEGDFNIHLPQKFGGHPDLVPSVIKVGLHSDTEGRLSQLTLGTRDLGNDDDAFERLNRAILQIVGQPGNPGANDVEVELDADYECRYEYTVKAISRCTGRIDPETGQMTRYVEKIKFAQPRKPKA